MKTWTESLGLTPLPIRAILSNLNSLPEELDALYQCLRTTPTTPACHLPEELLRDDVGKPMDATLEWLEEVMMEYLRYAIHEMRHERNGRGLQAMAYNTWNLMGNRAEQLLKGADPHFPLPQFAKAVSDTAPGSLPEIPRARATGETPQPDEQEGAAAPA